MDGRQCFQCQKLLFSKRKDNAYRRFCCETFFHRSCIGYQHMKRCPSCPRDADSTILWVPLSGGVRRSETILVEDTDHEPPVKKRKATRPDCSICFEQETEADPVLTTECCKMNAHVSCLRKYYQLPPRVRLQEECDKIAETLGVPNCFVCRGAPENIVPLDRNVLKAILPVVQKRPRFWTADQANDGLRIWKRLCKDALDTLKRWKYSMLLEHGTVTVQYENGEQKISLLRVIGEAIPKRRFHKLLCDQLVALVPTWAGLADKAFAFNQRTCADFRLHEICEMTLHLIVSNYYSRPKRCTRPDAHPFEVEFEQVKLSKWRIKAHLFDFDEISYEGLDEKRPVCPRLSHWVYELVRDGAAST